MEQGSVFYQKGVKKENLLSQYLVWQFYDVPKKLILIWQDLLLFNLNYFSIILLLKTLFFPWRRYKWFYEKGFDIRKHFETFFSNLISRVLGFIVRSLLIIIGLVFEIVIFFFGFIVLFSWLFLPFILISGFIFGLRIIL